MSDHPSNNVTLDNAHEVFTYHEPLIGQVAKYQGVRETGERMVIAILRHCPPCADRSAAIRKVREAVMTANAAIALEPVD